MEQNGVAAAVDDAADVGLAKNRSRREKKDRYGRKAAFEQLRDARSGQRSRYTISEERNIYEEVDEEEYSRIVRDRQDDDWIVDDGTGYVEDGREIFDDDPEAVVTAGKRKSTASAKPAKNPNIRPTDSKPKSIRGMFAAAAAKPKVQKAVNLEEDDILGDIMGELKKGDAQTVRLPPVKMLRQVEPGYPSARTNKVECNGFAGRVHPGNGVAVENPKYGSALAASRIHRDDSNFSNKSIEKPSSGHVKAATIRKEKCSYQQKSGTVGNVSSLSQQIQEFTSQDLPRHNSEVIEDFDNEMDTSAACSEVDVSGIDFNDNFEQDLTVNELPCVTAGLNLFD